ncbi:phosphoribosyltransferase [Putridiphycobacter roseus]|uniref:Phosphoribosyltransferase n=1 Tax=Putridiphycobacter roseus TaxID=2219161 RepID=A0A2W1NM02_9FLAO|nr:phosphoribosyltransferase family protein [Putridiphycobacter roseus]PZE15758.1 phosphoribosyltransferase [Putridiphycobacter roseus]
MKTEILNQSQIKQRIERIAFQIYENFYKEDQLFIGGIDGNGFIFAERLVVALKKIAADDFKGGIHLFNIKINKDAPLTVPIVMDISLEDLKGANVILVDDVINSGRTLIHAVRHLLSTNIHSIKTAVLVNRTHRRFPISADFEGMAISTTLQDKIKVQFGKQESAYLV